MTRYYEHELFMSEELLMTFIKQERIWPDREQERMSAT